MKRRDLPRRRELVLVGTPEHERLTRWMYDPTYLPTKAEVIQTWLALEDWSEGVPMLDPSNEWSRWSRNKEARVFEIWTKEYIQAFGDYLAARVQKLSEQLPGKIKILEVGAGNGRLTHFLKQELNQRIPDQFELVAVDSGTMRQKPIFEVEPITYQEALRKYQPSIVISSWMPMQKDWTADFRHTPSVQEYILIAPFEEMTGKPWETWGHEEYEEEEEEEAEEEELQEEKEPRPKHAGEIPPYAVDGFSQQELYALSEKQISPTEDMPIYDSNHTHTVSFRRGGSSVRRVPRKTS